MVSLVSGLLLFSSIAIITIFSLLNSFRLLQHSKQLQKEARKKTKIQKQGVNIMSDDDEHNVGESFNGDENRPSSKNSEEMETRETILFLKNEAR